MTVKSQNSVELQDLGNGHWRAVCGDRSIELDERDKDLTTTLGNLAAYAGYPGKEGPKDLAKILRTAVIDGLIPNSEIGGAQLVGLNSLKSQGVGPGPTWKSDIPCKDWTLTRKACLLLMTRCNKPRCIEFTRMMADVFERWLDRRHHVSAFSPDALAPILAPISQAMAYLTQKLDQQNEELSELRKEIHLLSSERSIVSDNFVRWIRQQLRQIAIFETGLPGRKMTAAERKVWKTSFGQITSDARNEAHLPNSRSWKELDPNRVNDVKTFLEIRLKRAKERDRLREPLMDWARRQYS